MACAWLHAGPTWRRSSGSPCAFSRAPANAEQGTCGRHFLCRDPHRDAIPCRPFRPRSGLAIGTVRSPHGNSWPASRGRVDGRDARSVTSCGLRRAGWARRGPRARVRNCAGVKARQALGPKRAAATAILEGVHVARGRAGGEGARGARRLDWWWWLIFVVHAR